MSQCDKCYRRIDEDDIFERTLCGRCYKGEKSPKLHCALCGASIRWKGVKDTVSGYFSSRKHILFLFGLLGIITLIILPFSPLLALKVAVGIIAIPVAIIALIAAFYLAVIVPYQIGSFINDQLDLEIPSLDENAGGFFRYLLGLLFCASPFLIYWLGSWVLSWFH
jgi:hypothetical protein